MPEHASISDLPSERTKGERHLIVIAKKDAQLRITRSSIESRSGINTEPLSRLLRSEGIVLKPLFGISEDRLRARIETMRSSSSRDGRSPLRTTVPDLSVYYQVIAPEERLDRLAETLREQEIVDAAYIKEPAQPAVFKTPRTEMMNLSAMRELRVDTTPSFLDKQVYLNAAPDGIDARYAWRLPGGRGTGVNIIDIEKSWCFTHEDLKDNQGGLISGTCDGDDSHGTAVLGIMGGDENAFGITGICPDAKVSSVSYVSNVPTETSAAIRIAADKLSPGDIISIEIQREGPRANGNDDQFGSIAIEWWPDDFDAIRYAVNKGIVVVEAAGNGGQDLDDAIYDNPLPGFPSFWKNPFNHSNPISEAVVVGAGNPPLGTHGRNTDSWAGETYADRARCHYSNYGSRVDAQGWGWEVTSTAYGDLQAGDDRDFWYTDVFNGTSSAVPIVVGVLGCLQGILHTNGGRLLTPARARELLSSTGSPQQDGPQFNFKDGQQGSYPQPHPSRPASQRIGNRPDLRQLIAKL